MHPVRLASGTDDEACHESTERETDYQNAKDCTDENRQCRIDMHAPEYKFECRYWIPVDTSALDGPATTTARRACAHREKSNHAAIGDRV